MYCLSVEDKINKILEKEREDHVLSVAADVLRALVILHGAAWKSDLMDTLTGLWSIRGLNLDDMIRRERLIPEALKELSESGLVRSEERFRSDLSRREPIKDELHSVRNLGALIRIFAADSLIEKYKREIMGYGALRF